MIELADIKNRLKDLRNLYNTAEVYEEDTELALKFSNGIIESKLEKAINSLSKHDSNLLISFLGIGVPKQTPQQLCDELGIPPDRFYPKMINITEMLFRYTSTKT